MVENTNPNTSSTNLPIQTSILSELISRTQDLLEKVDHSDERGKKPATDDGRDGAGTGSVSGGSVADGAVSGTDGGGAATAVPKPGLCGKLLSAVSCGNAESSEQRRESPAESTTTTVSTASGYSVHGGDGGGDGSKGRRSQMDKLRSNLDQIKTALTQLEKFENEFRSGFRVRSDEIEQLFKILDPQTPPSQPSTLPSDEAVEKRLREINSEVRKLKHRIPSAPSSTKASGAAHSDDRAQASGSSEAGSSGDKTVEGLLNLQETKSFLESSLYEDIKATCEKLTPNDKKCLLCFSLFAENEEIKKRMLTYWWEGEGFLEEAVGAPDGKKTVKEAAEEVLERFVAKGLIEAVYKKRWPEAKRYRMKAVVRSAVVRLAEEADAFIFDEHGNLAAKYSGGGGGSSKAAEEAKSVKKGSLLSSSTSKSLAGKDADSEGSESAKKNLNWLKKWGNEENLETIFNANEKFPDLRLKRLAKEKNLKAEEWLLRMKNLKVLYLGSWRASGKHHIEVDSTEFLQGLRNMSSLRLFSLQGISRISELTDSIKGLVNLEILDLKTCHNLEEIPEEIHFLRNLTHLDVANCYLIDHMPRGLAYLTKLQVLKGFVVGDYRNQTAKFCTLESLARMKSLRKLSIIISKKEFPTVNELKALEGLEALQNLTLSWGADSATPEETSDSAVTPPEETKGSAVTASSTTDVGDGQHTAKEKEHVINICQTKSKGVLGRSLTLMSPRDNTHQLSEPQLPKNLKKLDLQCYPQRTSPHWLSPHKLENLERLYIRGGKLGNSDGRFSGRNQPWKSVRSLRLKYLAAMKMSWEEMQCVFPSLIYLEKVDCPLITLCPCDEDGVWVINGSTNDKAKA